jgi:hypothetical protein
MSLEQKIELLIAAVEANTAALKGGSAAPAGKAPAAGKAAAAGKTDKAKAVTVEQAQAAVTKIKNDFSLEEAKKVLTKCKLAKLAEVSDDNADAVYKAALKHHEALTAAGEEEPEEEEEDGI